MRRHCCAKTRDCSVARGGCVVCWFFVPAAYEEILTLKADQVTLSVPRAPASRLAFSCRRQVNEFGRLEPTRSESRFCQKRCHSRCIFHQRVCGARAVL